MQPVDIEREKTAIQKAASEHAVATSRGGVEGARGYASFATADARWLPPWSPAISGREAIEQWVTPFTEMKDFWVTWEHPHVVVARSEDIGYSVGTYKSGGQDREGKTQFVEGKLVNIWHKQADGSWKVAVAIWNTDEPATASGA